MKSVSLLSVAPSNFKSFIKPGAIQISHGPGFKYLTGDNKQEPRLGANGAGKSSLLDAIHWCAFGTSIKGRKASDLKSWGSKGRPEVECTYLIDDKQHTIRRMGSPDALFIDGEDAAQEEVNRLLGLSKARFRHAVMFGQNVDFFAELSIPERGALLEEVLDLGIWQRASNKAGQERENALAELNSLTHEKSRNEGRLEGMPLLKDLRAQEAAWSAAQDEKKAAARKRLGKERMRLERLDAVAEVPPEYSDEEEDKWTKKVRRARRALRGAEDAVLSAQGELRETEKKLKHMQDNPKCPTCKQAWPEEATWTSSGRSGQMQQLSGEIRQQTEALASLKAEAKEAGEEQDNLLAGEELFRERRQVHLDKASATRGELRAQRRLVKELEEQAEQDEENPYSKEILDLKDKRAALKGRIKQAEMDILGWNARVEELAFWRDAFKRVRLFEMRRVLLHLELEVEAAVEALGLHGWTIKFFTETETKSGGSKQGIQIEVASPIAAAPWESWSGGESQRLTLAIALGFASLIQRMSGVRYTFEFWDEPSAWLSAEGIEDMLATLRSRSEAEGLSLWLVDHRSGMAAFDETWVVRKGKDGSHVTRA